MSSRNGDRDVKTRALKNKTGKMRGGDMKKNNNKTLSVLATKQLQSAPSTFSTFSANPDNSMSFNEAMFPKVFKDRSSSHSCHLSSSSAGYNELAELDAFWTVGFVDEANRNRKRQMQKEIKKFTGLPGFTAVPECRVALSDSSESNFNVSTYKGGCSLTDIERNRLEELERRLERNEAARKLKTLQKTEAKGRDNMSDNAMKQKRKQIKVYKSVNQKLRRFLDGSHPPRNVKPSVRSSAAESVLMKVQLEMRAATILQKWWRRFAAQLVNPGHHCLPQLVYVINSLLHLWHRQKSNITIRMQSVVRMWLSNTYLKSEREKEEYAVIRIQAFRRGITGRRNAYKEKKHQAAICAQRIWRGHACRKRLHRVWLDKQAIKVQMLARSLVARRVVQLRRTVFTIAAVLIQRTYRGFSSRQIVSQLMYDRETINRRDKIRSLAAEEDSIMEHIVILEKRLQKLNLHETLKTAAETEVAAHITISKYIEDLRDHEIQLHMCTQKEEEEGWKKELLKSKKQKRDETTQAKLDAIFGIARSAREVEEELNDRETSIRNLKRKVEALTEWRELAKKDLKQRESAKNETEAKYKWKQKVADEKRKWRAEFFTPSGKPDKLKSQCSKYWSGSEKLAADKEEQVYTGGALDILAEAAPSASDESIDPAIVRAKIKLQNHTNQVALFDDVFRPVEEILSRYTAQMGELAAPLSVNKFRTSTLNSGVNPNAEGNTIMNERGWKVDSGNINLQQQHQTEDVMYDEMLPHSSSPHSIARQSSSHSQTLGGEVMDLGRRRQPFRGFAEKYGAAASIISVKGPPPSPGSYSSWDPLQSDSRAKLRWRNRQIHLLAEMDAKESVGGVNTKESMSYELLGKLENEEYKLERFRALDYRMVENSE